MPLLIKANMLASWSNERDAQHLLPVLIRKLITETIPDDKIHKIEFPGYENVQYSGVDGRLTAESQHTFIPNGESVWELGTGKNPKAKADKDYEKRIKIAKKDTTFMFITSRNWPTKKQEWIDEQNENTLWKEVRVLDANDLEQWLQQSPSATFWLSEQMGYSQQHLETNDCFLNNWLESTDPKFSSKLLLDNRESSKQKLEDFLKDDLANSNLSVIADTRDEAVAFICVVLEESEYSKYPAAILKNENAIYEIQKWQHKSELPYIIIAYSDEIMENIPPNLINKNKVICVGARQGISIKSSLEENAIHKSFSIILPRVENFEHFYPKHMDNKTWYSKTGGSVSALHRMRNVNSAKRKPTWTKITKKNRNFIWLTLLGRWNESYEADKGIICSLSNSDDYRSWQKFVQELVEAEESPLEKTPGKQRNYRLFSRVDAFLSVANEIEYNDIKEFLNVAQIVLCECDPNYHPASENNSHRTRKSRNYSETLRQGIVDGLAILNLYKNDPLECGDITNDISYFYDKIFESENAWNNLADCLPALAEASADDFICKLKDALRENEEKIGDLFTPRIGILLDNFMHQYLLWALESLAWKEERLKDILCLLCRLQKKFEDLVGDRLNNKPSQTMQNIMRPWMPQTAASIEHRIAVLNSIYEDFPAQIAELSLSIADMEHRIGHYTHSPIWHDDALNIPATTFNDVQQMRDAAIKIITQHIKNEKDSQNSKDDNLKSRFGVAEKSLGNFHNWDKETIFSIKDAIFSLPRDESDLTNSLSEIARQTLSWQKRVLDRDDEKNNQSMQILKDIREEFSPTDLSHKYAYLFSHWLNIEIDDFNDDDDDYNYEKLEERIEDARSLAIKEILKKNNYKIVVNLLSLCEDPRILSESLFKDYIGKGQFDLEKYLIECFQSDITIFKLKQHVSYIFGWTKNYKDIPDALDATDVITIIENVIKELNNCKQSEQLIEKKRILFHALRIDQKTGRDYIDKLPEKIKKQYFSEYRFDRRSMELVFDKDSSTYPPEVTWLIDGYLKYKHPRQGWHSLHVYNIPIDKQIDLLEAILIEGQDEYKGENFIPRNYDIEKLFKKAGERNDLTDEQESRLLGIEFKFFNWMPYEFRKKGGIFVLRHIFRSPAFLVEIAQCRYKNDERKNAMKKIHQKNLSLYADISFEILHYLNLFSKSAPWRQSENEIDDISFLKWVTDLRNLAKKEKMTHAIDMILGSGLSWDFLKKDNLGVFSLACRVLEESNSEDMLSAFRTGIYNSRGVITNGIDKKGYSTSQLAQHYKEMFNDIQDTYPNVASIMNDLAKEYIRQAELEEQDRDKLKLEWR